MRALPFLLIIALAILSPVPPQLPFPYAFQPLLRVQNELITQELQ